MARQRTSTYVVRVSKGQIEANEYAVIIKPKFWSPDQSSPGAIYCPALSTGALNVVGWGPAFELAKMGFVVVTSDLGNTPSVAYGTGLPASVGGTGTGSAGVWAQTAAMTKLTTVYNYMLNVLGVKGPKISLMGGSHGGATSVRWAAENPSKVDSLLLGIGCVDQQDILTNNRAGFAASVQQAYGLGSGTTLPAGVNGVDLAPSLACPVRDYYSDDDVVTPAARHTAFAAANPSKISAISFGAVGHTTTNFPNAAAADWILTKVS